jgi:hypothetical protein
MPVFWWDLITGAPIDLLHNDHGGHYSAVYTVATTELNRAYGHRRRRGARHHPHVGIVTGLLTQVKLDPQPRGG